MLLLQNDGNKVLRTSFSGDGTLLSTYGTGPTNASIWNLATRARTVLSPENPDTPWYGAFAPRTSRLVVGSQVVLRLWPDPANLPGNFFALGGNGFGFIGSSIGFRPDGEEMAVLGIEPESLTSVRFSVFFLATKNGFFTERPAILLDGIAVHLVWSPTQPLLAGVRATSEPHHSTLRLMSLEPPYTQRDGPALPELANALSFSPDGQIICMALEDTIYRWFVDDLEELDPLKGHVEAVNSLVHLPDGRLISAGNDGTVRAWDHDSGKCLDVRDWQEGAVGGLSVAADGMRAAVGSERGQAIVWDVD